jgi:hypothetical protein
MGTTDKFIRVILAVIIAFLYYNQTIYGTLGIVLLIIASVFVATSLISFCPLYKLVGINTCPTKNK